jgi:hypothetical protein
MAEDGRTRAEITTQRQIMTIAIIRAMSLRLVADWGVDLDIRVPLTKPIGRQFFW